MNEFDLTVAVTAHSETLVAGPSMRSAELAIRAAEAEGFRVERLIGLDTATEDCRTFFRQPAYAGWKLVEFQFKDPYPARNALVEMAKGRWIAFLDADDLVSENWLVVAARCLAEAEKSGNRVIVHPEMNWIFDGASSVFTKTPQDDPLFAPHYFYFANYYDMMCMAPRDAHRQVPYAHRDLARGFGYGDWQWNIEVVAAGWRHVVVKDTIVFKRRRETSVSRENMARRTIIFSAEGMAIDNVRTYFKKPAVQRDA